MPAKFVCTVGFVARQLGVDAATVRNAVDLGHVPSIRDSAKRRLLPDNAAEILERRREATGHVGGRAPRRGG